ncbi:hypothetical protein AWB80_08442 [Caballeronia pedi]|uniref:Uncharacterized protein n=1 Tax=Caballeronia pedi TaxID=1777141 RepID=A0A158E7P8_9BURK|nr:hypothetical protein [Caballeronia pedi]SAL02793.1 hypothetical protein AWB80_08442 [Caballeronia pedi]
MFPHHVVPLRSALHSLADVPAERQEPAAKQTGYRLRTGKPSKAKTVLTDAQVLRMREQHEFEGVPARKLAEEYGLDREYVYKLLDYRTRSKLIPARHKTEKPVKPGPKRFER